MPAVPSPVICRRCRRRKKETGRIKEGEQFYRQAHEQHGEILLKEVNTLEPQITLLMSHAEDQIMSAELVRVLVEELIEIYTNQKGA